MAFLLQQMLHPKTKIEYLLKADRELRVQIALPLPFRHTVRILSRTRIDSNQITFINKNRNI